MIRANSANFGKSGVLSEDQLEFYERNGYLLWPACLSEEEVEKFNKRFKQICLKEINVPGMMVMKSAEGVKSEFSENGGRAITKLTDFHFDDQLFEYCLHPQIVKIVQNFIGPNLLAVHTMYINKEPDTGSLSSRHPLHQDLYYFPFRPADKIICAWTALAPVNRQNGCLSVLPGSHKNPLFEHDYPQWEGGVNKMYYGIKDFRNDQPLAYLEMQPGDTVFFHPLLIHGSGTNKTNGFRKAISCHYAAGECHYIDVTGTIQEVARSEIVNVAKARSGVDIKYEDIWRFRARLVTGIRSNL